MTAARAPHQTAVIDELGALSYGELDRRANALAASLAAHGIRPGDGVAIMCRNHRGFMDATVAVSRLGAHALYLNTMFAAPQLADVVAARGREGDRLRRGVRRARSTTPEACGCASSPGTTARAPRAIRCSRT